MGCISSNKIVLHHTGYVTDVVIWAYRNLLLLKTVIFPKYIFNSDLFSLSRKTIT
jgi:hypothetical protein